METIIQLLGLGIFIIGRILFLIEAFKTSLLWGLGCVFLAPANIFYLAFHWGNAKKIIWYSIGRSLSAGSRTIFY